VPHFLAVHESGADWTNECRTAPPAKREDNQNVPAVCARSNGFEPSLMARMSRIGMNDDGTLEQSLDLGNLHAVFLALVAIAVVPVEASSRTPLHALLCTFVHTSQGAAAKRQVWRARQGVACQFRSLAHFRVRGRQHLDRLEH
jgi:hypothetical protein